MVTIQQAVQNLQRAKTQISEREANISEAERRGKAIRVSGTITRQFELEKRFGRGRAAAGLKQVRRERANILERVRKARRELDPVKRKVKTREAEIKRVQTNIKERESLLSDIRTAEKLARTGGLLLGQNKRVRMFFRQEVARRRALKEQTRKLTAIRKEGLKPIFIKGKLVGFKAEDLKQSIILKDLPAQFLPPLEKAGVIEIKKRELSIGEFRSIEAEIGAREFQLPTGKFGGIDITLPSQDPFSKATGFVREKFGPTTAQFVIPFIRTGEFGFGLATKPKETLVGLGLGIKGIGERVVTGKGFPEIGRFAQQDPLGFTARVSGEIFALKGTGKVISLTGKGFELGGTIISPKFKPVKTRELLGLGVKEKFISIPEIKGAREIGLIPVGLERKAFTIRPTVRGGFGFSAKEQAKFLGKKGPITTAQIDFKGFGIPLERELFATPPFKEIGFVRVSRLGLEQKEATLLDIIGGDFTFKKTKPQIIVFPKEVVGRRGGFQPQLKGTELETILPLGKIPIKIGVPAVTIIGGRRVTIITAKIGEGLTEKALGLQLGKGLGKDITQQFGKGLGTSTLDTRAFFPTRKIGTSLGLSITKQLSQTLKLTSKDLGVSFPTKPSPRKRTGKITPARITSFTFGIPSPKVTSPKVTGFTFGGFTGITTAKITEFGVVPIARGIAEGRPKVKKVKLKRKRKITPLLPSFTAIVADLRGAFPKEVKIGKVELGILPSKIRRLPRRKKKK